MQNLDEEMRVLDERRSALTRVEIELRSKGPAEADIAAVIAALPQNANPEVRRLADQIQTKRTELRSLLTEEQLAAGHPRVLFTQSEITSLGVASMS